jgi:hypothetical protein
MSDPVRPRFGRLVRANGATVPLVFRETDTAGRFEALTAGDELPVKVEPGDSFQVDVLGPGQSVVAGVDL